MNREPPILESKAPSEEQQRLKAMFAEIETQQLAFLDEAGKRIIELTTALLGLLFAVIAFGDTFPPPYLAGNLLAKFLSIVTLACYLGAMLLALRAVQPRDYKRYRHNLDGMREELDSIVANKSRSLRWAGWLFWLACAALALLIVAIIVS